MATPDHPLVVSLTTEGEIRFRSEQGDRTSSPAEAFAIGDSMVQTRKFAAATKIFEALGGRCPGDLQILIMSARCRAGQGDYHGCNDLLQSAFTDTDFRSSVTLQSAFVYEALGLWSNAISALDKAADRHRDLPLLRVLLGDYYLRQGTAREAERSWKSVLTGGDGSDGYVMFLVRKRLARLAKIQADGPQHRR